MMGTNKPQDRRGVAELLAGCRTGTDNAESDAAMIEILAVFDHDYESHVLVQEWDRTNPERGWLYRLWSCSVTGDIVVVATFEDAKWPNPPFVEAATIVADWRTVLSENSRKRYG